MNLLVEIPAGSRNKYEYSPEAGLMVLDRVFHAAIRYPFDYGFVPVSYTHLTLPTNREV